MMPFFHLEPLQQTFGGTAALRQLQLARDGDVAHHANLERPPPPPITVTPPTPPPPPRKRTAHDAALALGGHTARAARLDGEAELFFDLAPLRPSSLAKTREEGCIVFLVAGFPVWLRSAALLKATRA